MAFLLLFIFDVKIAFIANYLLQYLGKFHLRLFLGYIKHLVNVVLVNEGCLNIVHFVNKLTLIATCDINRL